MNQLEALLEEHYSCEPSPHVVDRLIYYLDEHPRVTHESIDFIKRITMVGKRCMDTYPYIIQPRLPTLIQYCDDGLERLATSPQPTGAHNYALTRLLGHKATMSAKLFELHNDCDMGLQAASCATEVGRLTEETEQQFAMFYYTLAGQVMRSLCSAYADTIYAKGWYDAHKIAGKLARGVSNGSDGNPPPHMRRHAAQSFLSAAAGAMFMFKRKPLKEWRKRTAECCDHAWESASIYSDGEMDGLRSKVIAYRSQIKVPEYPYRARPYQREK